MEIARSIIIFDEPTRSFISSVTLVSPLSILFRCNIKVYTKDTCCFVRPFLDLRKTIVTKTNAAFRNWRIKNPISSGGRLIRKNMSHCCSDVNSIVDHQTIGAIYIITIVFSNVDRQMARYKSFYEPDDNKFICVKL